VTSFDEIDHSALMGRLRRRVGDKRVLGLVTAFLRAGILSQEGRNRETITGTPQGGILSPLLANIALSVLEEHFAARWAALGPEWKRVKHRRRGHETRALRRRLCATNAGGGSGVEDGLSWKRCCTGDGGWPSGTALQGRSQTTASCAGE
jgi:hypothetical protein